MEAILQWGLDVIRAVQTISSAPLTVFFRIITSFGGTAVYLLLMPFFYWCIDEKKGIRLASLVLISIWVNLTLKFLFNQPRPFFEGYDPSVGLIDETMGGLPSGHAQNSLVIYFLLASFLKKNQGYVCAGVLCFLIGFSRIYLGVHFPTDVFAGWILGSAILCAYFLFHSRIELLFQKGGFRAEILTIALVSFIMILYLPDRSLIMPGAVFLGFGAGYLLNRRYIGFRSRDVLIKPGAYLYFIIFLRMIIGIAGFVLILFLIGKLIPQAGAQDDSNQNLFVFIQLALGGFWISFAAPWLFVRLNLAPARLDQDV